jgi:hypothetical protein
VRRFLSDVTEALQKAGRPPAATAIRSVTTCATTGHAGWELVQPALVAREIDGSPFEFHKLLQAASQSAFIIGQNLFSLTCGHYAATAERELFAFLGRRGTSVRFLVQAPGPGVDAWNSLNPRFGEDLEAAKRILRKWLKRAQSDGVNSRGRLRLQIREAPLVPVSYDIVDSELPSGLMVFRHSLHRAPQPAVRPVFALQGGRSNPVFKHYLDCWNGAFQDARIMKPA